MTYPFYHPGEECEANVAASDGSWMRAEIKEVLPRKSIVEIDGKLYECLFAYRVRLFGATKTCVFDEFDLRKRWERCDWGMLRGIWQPKREAR